MNWNLSIQVVTVVILKLIASSLFLIFCSEVFYKPVQEEEPTVILEADCSVGWSPFKGKCYYFSTRVQTWDESQKTCAESGSKLAVVNSKEELAFLMSRTQFEKHFIGLTQSHGKWAWIDGTGFDPNMFDFNQKLFSCVAIGFNSVDSASCSVSHRYICEKIA